MDRRLRSGGQQWTEREAREALAELQDRGESVAAFAQRRGMSVQRVYYWRRRLRETAAPAFVAMPLTAVASDQIEICSEGITVRVREGIAAEHLANVVEALTQRGRRC